MNDLALRAARNDRALRELGITIRKTADVIMGTYSIEHRCTMTAHSRR
jgi:hypothetical protein